MKAKKIDDFHIRFPALYGIKEAKKLNVSDEAKNDAKILLEYCISIKNSCSKDRFYDRLTEWSKPIYDFMHDELKKFGFKNGDMEYNKKFPNIEYWWYIYGAFGSVYLSPNTKCIGDHHMSAYDRNEAWIKELEYLLKE